jgi:hypothetical protein
MLQNFQLMHCSVSNYWEYLLIFGQFFHLHIPLDLYHLN